MNLQGKKLAFVAEAELGRVDRETEKKYHI